MDLLTPEEAHSDPRLEVSEIFVQGQYRVLTQFYGVDRNYSVNAYL